MKIYLDNCCFNRPYDFQGQTSIRLETEAKLVLQKMVVDGTLDLCWSYILDYENSRNPYPERKEEIGRWRDMAVCDTGETDAIVQHMRQFTAMGINAMDALHLASSIECMADCFVTVDRKVLNRMKNSSILSVCTPIDLVLYLEYEHE